jgi:hypothetical protein
MYLAVIAMRVHPASKGQKYYLAAGIMFCAFWPFPILAGQLYLSFLFFRSRKEK